MRRLAISFGVTWLFACGSSPSPASPSDAALADMGVADMGVAADAAPADTAPDDAADTAGQDAAPADLSAADALPADATSTTGKATAWGTITGACGGLQAEIASPLPSFRVNTYTFDQAAFDPKPLRTLAQKRYSGPNAGGSSKCSEAMSMQTLFDCEGLLGLKTELEIAFTVQGQTTDWLGEIGGTKVGVSVSRAYQGPSDDTYTVEDADKLLKKKLGGINESTQNVAPADKWKKQVLHIWTLQPKWVATLKQAWEALDPALKADTVIVVTIEQGSTAITADTCGAK